MNKLLQDNRIINREITKEQYLELATSRVQNISNTCFHQLVTAQREGVECVWNNPNLTAQEVIDSLGDNAIKVFQFHGALTEFIKYVASIDGIDVDLKYPTNAFEIVDGKIVVLDTPYVV